MSISAASATTSGGVISGGNETANVASSLGINTGNNNSVSFGFNCAPLNLGYSNTFLGYNAASKSTFGNGITVVGYNASPYVSGGLSTYIGSITAPNATTGGANVVVGALAASNLSYGSSNVAVGAAAGVVGDASKATALGQGAFASTTAVAAGCAAVAVGRQTVALGAGATATGDGAFCVAGRLRGYFSPSNAPTGTYTVRVDADALKIGGGGALAFCAPLSTASSHALTQDPDPPAAWAVGVSSSDGSSSSNSDLVFRSAGGAVVRLLDDFRPGLLDFTAQHHCKLFSFRGESLGLRPSGAAVSGRPTKSKSLTKSGGSAPRPLPGSSGITGGCSLESGESPGVVGGSPGIVGGSSGVVGGSTLQSGGSPGIVGGSTLKSGGSPGIAGGSFFESGGSPGIAGGSFFESGGSPGIAGGCSGIAGGSPGIAGGCTLKSEGSPGIAGGCTLKSEGSPGIAGGCTLKSEGSPGIAGGLPGIAGVTSYDSGGSPGTAGVTSYGSGESSDGDEEYDMAAVLGLPGRIVVSTGRYESARGSRVVSPDEAVPIVRMSSTACDPRAFGTIACEDGAGGAVDTYRFGNLAFEVPSFVPADGESENDSGGSRRWTRNRINAAGEGGVWACDENGPLRNGDLLVTSGALTGVAMRQSDDVVRSCTVAKITCDCDFEGGNGSPGPVVQVGFMKACLVGCVYKF